MNLADLDLLGLPMLAGLIVLATHVPLGRRVLARGIVFMDLAVAQFAALGVIAAGVWGWHDDPLALQFAALGMALVGATLLTFTRGLRPAIQEALIGSSFVLAASAGLVLLSSDPHGGEHLKDLLAGQILWVDEQQLAFAAIASLALLALLRWRPDDEGAGFYLAFAVAVTLSVQMVGVYLVFASLIFPVLAVRRDSAEETRPALKRAYLLGAAGYALGLLLSLLGDWPAGATIVLALGLVGSVYRVAGLGVRA
jgi:zinc/manganese transport system permease protein